MTPRAAEPYLAPHLPALAAHAAAWYPRECCALIVADAAGDSALVLADNLADALHAADPEAHPRTARTAFVLDPRLVARAEREGRRLVAIVHSHCDVGAYFSAEDERLARSPIDGEPLWPGVDHVVLDVRAGVLVALATFRWAEVTRTFEAV